MVELSSMHMASEKYHRTNNIELQHYTLPDQFSDPASFKRVSEFIGDLSAMGYYGNSSVDFGRKRKSRIDLDNPSTREFLRLVPTAEHWLSMVPTVSALDSLYDPQSMKYTNGYETSPEAREWLSNCLDGVGIRSRARVVQDVIASEIKDLGRKNRVLSLACGAAQPVLNGVKESFSGGRSQQTEVTLVDYDKGALGLADKYAKELGVKVGLRRRNILERSGIADSQRGLLGAALGGIYRRSQLKSGSYDVVEAVGILEYLKPEDWAYRYNGVINTTRSMAGAVSFMRNAYDLVRPGGFLVVGNMLDTHPQIGFTLNVIQWPHIQPRSIDQMAGIFNEAGIGGGITAHLPDDGVYAIYTIRKPG